LFPLHPRIFNELVSRMAYIQKLPKTGKWQAQIQRNGKRSSKSFDTKREAQAWAMAQEAQAKKVKAGGGFTFGDAVDKYLKEVSSKKDGERWERLRLEAMRRHFGTDTPLSDIDTPQVAAWRDWRLSGDDTHRPVTGSTVYREGNLLRGLFNVAKDEWKWMQHEPFAGARMPTENQPRQTVWGWKLIKRVLCAPRYGKTKEVQDAFHIALRTGMRLGEVLAAPQRYNKVSRVVTLENVQGARKTDPISRIPIGRLAAKLLERPVFEVDANEASVLFSKLCKQLLITGLTFHDTRATALTHLAKKVDVMTLAKISRHKDLNLLMNTYYRPKPSDISKLI
jgi:integrase